MEYGAAGAEAAAMKHRATATAAAERCGPAVKSTSAMEATSTVKAAATVETTSTTAMSTTTMSSTTADFGRQSARGGFRRRRRTRIDQRQRLRGRWNG